jgi:hypothetical protein
MTDPQIWSNAAAENTQVVVYTDGVFYGGETDQLAKLERQVNEGEDPAALLGKQCKYVAFDDITRVVANNVGDLELQTDDGIALKLPMHQAGVQVLEAIQDAKGRRWVSDVESKNRIGSAFVSLLVGIVMGGGMLWIYFGVVGGRIERMHWFGALLVNYLGPTSLLVLGALIFLGGMFGFGWYLTHPAEVWTAEEE